MVYHQKIERNIATQSNCWHMYQSMVSFIILLKMDSNFIINVLVVGRLLAWCRRLLQHIIIRLTPLFSIYQYVVGRKADRDGYRSQDKMQQVRSLSMNSKSHHTNSIYVRLLFVKKHYYYWRFDLFTGQQQARCWQSIISFYVCQHEGE
jgi:hypothetical protein